MSFLDRVFGQTNRSHRTYKVEPIIKKDKAYIFCKSCGHYEEINKELFASILGGAVAVFGAKAWIGFLFAGTGFAFPLCAAIVLGGVGILKYSKEIAAWLCKRYECVKCGEKNWIALSGKELLLLLDNEKLQDDKAKIQKEIDNIEPVLRDMQKEMQEENNRELQALYEQQKRELEELKKAYENAIKNSDSRGIKRFTDAEIGELVLNLMDKVQYRMDIICPWASEDVVNTKFLRKIAKMAERGVELYIGYGYSERDDRLKDTETQLRKIQDVYAEKGKSDKIHIIFKRTHEKVVLCDDDVCFVGSCNILSKQTLDKKHKSSRMIQEGGVLFYDKKTAEEIRTKEFRNKRNVIWSDIGKQ